MMPVNTGQPAKQPAARASSRPVPKLVAKAVLMRRKDRVKTGAQYPRPNASAMIDSVLSIENSTVLRTEVETSLRQGEVYTGIY